MDNGDNDLKRHLKIRNFISSYISAHTKLHHQYLWRIDYYR